MDAFKNLATDIKDARVHCAVLKLRAVSPPFPAPHCQSSWFDRGFDPLRRGGLSPNPQDPTARLSRPHTFVPFSVRQAGRTEERHRDDGQLVNVPPLSSTSNTNGPSVGLDAGEPTPDAP